MTYQYSFMIHTSYTKTDDWGYFWLKVIEEINQFHLGAQGNTKTFAQDKFLQVFFWHYRLPCLPCLFEKLQQTMLFWIVLH